MSYVRHHHLSCRSCTIAANLQFVCTAQHAQGLSPVVVALLFIDFMLEKFHDMYCRVPMGHSAFMRACYDPNKVCHKQQILSDFSLTTKRWLCSWERSELQILSLSALSHTVGSTLCAC